MESCSTPRSTSSASVSTSTGPRRARELAQGIRADLGFLDDARRAFLPLPFDERRAHLEPPFPVGVVAEGLAGLEGRRIGIAATGGSGALASLVGVARAFEELEVAPAVISACSGSALFAFPLAAGLSAREVAEFTEELAPEDLIDPDWRKVVSAPLRRGAGFAGVLRGDAIERTYRRLLGDRTLGELDIPAYAPIWNVDDNTVDFLGPRTHPDLAVARAVRMAVALPLFFDPVRFDGAYRCDGGIVDIFPVRPLLDLEPRCDTIVAVNGFYPRAFDGEDASGWMDRPLSILTAAGQLRTCQQQQLAREHLAALEAATEVLMIEPVAYERVRGVGFYREFLSTADWPEFMRAGRAATRQALEECSKHHVAAARRRDRTRSA